MEMLEKNSSTLVRVCTMKFMYDYVLKGKPEEFRLRVLEHVVYPNDMIAQCSNVTGTRRIFKKVNLYFRFMGAKISTNINFKIVLVLLSFGYI